MAFSDVKVCPVVYKSYETATVHFIINDPDVDDNTVVRVRFHPVEHNVIPHTNYNLNNLSRYPLVELNNHGGGHYSVEYTFEREQKYCAVTTCDKKLLCLNNLYAVDADLAELDFYKADFHLHTTGSDGRQPASEVGCAYRKAGFDCISVTDHHFMQPSRDAKTLFDPLTDLFHLYVGEEVHNEKMGCFHIINFDNNRSVNTVIEDEPEYYENEVQKTLASTEFDEGVDKYACAWRIVAVNEIKKGGGLAIMAHPYWFAGLEYNMQPADVVWLWKNKVFDALELMSGEGENDNLAMTLWEELRVEGCKIPVVGVSDSHDVTGKIYPQTLFDKHFTMMFSKGFEGAKDAILDERSVAVKRLSDNTYVVWGRYRYVKWARFLLEEYYTSEYIALCEEHGKCLEELIEKGTSDNLKKVESDLADYKKRFFSFSK